MTDVVLVTQPEFAKGRRLLWPAARLAGHCRGGRRSFARPSCSLPRVPGSDRGSAAISGRLYEALGETGGAQGAIISRFGVGHDSIDKHLARQHGIVVTNTPGVLDRSVAEHTLWLIGSLARHVATCHWPMKSGQWHRAPGWNCVAGRWVSSDLERLVERWLRSRISDLVCGSSQPTAYPPRSIAAARRKRVRRRSSASSVWTNTLTDIDRIFRDADVLSIHLPAVEATRNFVNADRLASMKPDGLLINTARGSVLDEDALYEAMSSGRLAGAALDVYQHEPYRPQSPGRDLRTLPNIVLTPHIGSNTVEANEAMARAALGNVTNFLHGRLRELTRVEGTKRA